MRPRVVIAHDFCEAYGGAERFTAEIARLYPDAPVVALLGRRSVVERMGIADRVRFLLPPRPWLLRNYRLFAPAYFGLVRTARLPDADVLISSNYAYAQGFRPPPGAAHLCYTWGPFRHLWSQEAQYAAELPFGPVGQRLFRAYSVAGRWMDRLATRAVDTFVTSSPYTSGLLEQAYGRPAEILPPPIDSVRFHPGPEPPEDYFLFVGRLTEAYKKPSLVVEAFNRMPHLKLKIAGDGHDRERLMAGAGPNIEFLGHLGDDDLVRVMQRCRAAVFPSTDDFGLVPLEVNACGRPVIAYAAGGALHTVVDGVTGALFGRQSAEGIVEAVERFDADRFDPVRIRAHGLTFDTTRFRAGLGHLVSRLLDGHQTVGREHAHRHVPPVQAPLWAPRWGDGAHAHPDGGGGNGVSRPRDRPDGGNGAPRPRFRRGDPQAASVPAADRAAGGAAPPERDPRPLRPRGPGGGDPEDAG